MPLALTNDSSGWIWLGCIIAFGIASRRASRHVIESETK